MQALGWRLLFLAWWWIEVVKRVDINTDDISSKEDLIGFEKVKISDLPGTKLYPVVIKNWIVERFK